MRRFLAAAAVVLAFAGCRQEFRVSGTITLASSVHHKVPAENSVIFVVAKNRGGVPIALHRIVNPQFPVSFMLTEEDLIVPSPRPDDPLSIEVEMNTHGSVGAPRAGDLEGSSPDAVFAGSRGVNVVIDRLIDGLAYNGPSRRRPAD